MQPLVQALLDPAAYDHPVTGPELVETHISWVILTGDYAYKIKKPLDLGFLDFSTLDLRRHFCEEELRLNRRLAPDLYLAVVPITGSVEHPRLGGTGPALEYAVRMRQFPADARLDRRLAAGRLTAQDMDTLAARIAAFHRAAPPVAPGEPYGTPDAVHRPVRENFDQIAPRLTADTDRADLADAASRADAAFGHLKPLLAARRLEGRVRECHGDLHLANLVALPDGITAFDCIEFSPALRWVDVMSELAFLMMDLRHRGRADLAYRFADRYLQHTGDYGGAVLLPYYMSYRAMVRAKVSAIALDQQGSDAAGRPALLDEYRGYVNLARQLLVPARPALLITHGLSGSGKTWLADRLVETLPALRVRSDVERKRLHGVQADAASGSGVGTGIYTPEAGARTYAHLAACARTMLDGGHTVIIDAAFLERAQRDAFRELAREHGADFLIVDCQAPPEILAERIARRQAAAQDASEADMRVLEHQRTTVEPIADSEAAYTLRVDTSAPDQLQLTTLLRERLG